MQISNRDWAVFEGAFGGMSEKTRKGLARYLELLISENERVNLTSITDWDEGVWKHLYDSLLVLRGKPEGVVLDWGTGGGTPGIPLALWALGSGAKISKIILLDSIGKKVRAVDGFVSSLRLFGFAEAVQGRGEEFILREPVDCVVMRAVAPPDRVLPWMSTKVKHWIFMVGPQSMELWRAALPALKKKGFSLAGEVHEALPGDLGERFVLSFVKS